VIPKIHRRSQIVGLGDLLGYLFGPGLDNERGGRHDNPRVIAAWVYATSGNLADLQPSQLSPQGRPSVRRLTELLEQPARICWSLPALPVWHCSIHNHPDDPILTDQNWEHIVTEIAAAVGLAPHDDVSAVRWIGIRHAESHAHLVATLARQDRRAVWLWQDYRRAQACCRQLEQHYDLHRVGGRLARTRYPTPAELNKTSRQRRDEVPRQRLRRLVGTAAGTASDEQDFLHRLRTSGLLVRPRGNTTDPSQVAGYAVALPEDRNAAGDTIWYSGATLAADLSLPNLRRRWRSS
jgi:MobA/VirD2-like, nuclease domain